MGAEESSMYPASEQRASSASSNGGHYARSSGAARPPTPKKVAPAMLPQAVLLVGYTPDGAPILMADPAQNSLATLTARNKGPQSTLPPIIATQAAFLPTLTGAPTQTLHATTMPLSEAGNIESLTNILETHTPVIAVPKTILGPDGKPYTALVHPTSSSGALLMPS